MAGLVADFQGDGLADIGVALATSPYSTPSLLLPGASAALEVAPGTAAGLSSPPANGRWTGLFAWDKGCGGKHAGKIDADG